MKHFTLTLVTVLALNLSAQAASLLLNGDFSADVGVSGPNELAFENRDNGWVIKSNWDLSGGNAVNTGSNDTMRRALAQVATISGASGSLLRLSLDWTAPATAIGDALNLTYVVVGWKSLGDGGNPSATGDHFFSFINGKPSYGASGLKTAGADPHSATFVDFVLGTGAVQTGYNTTQSFGTFTSTNAGTSQPFSSLFDLSGFGAGYNDISDYDYIGIRISTGTDGTSELISGGIIDNLSLATATIPEPSRAVLMGLGMLGLILRRRR